MCRRCRRGKVSHLLSSYQSYSLGADARVRAEIAATLKQFARIKQVVILTKDGHCFGDESGADRCVR